MLTKSYKKRLKQDVKMSTEVNAELKAKFVSKLAEEFNNKGKVEYIDPSITDIDGMSVTVEMQFHQHYCQLIVRSTIYLQEGQLCLYYGNSKRWVGDKKNCESIGDVLDEFIETISNLHFNKREGKLTEQPEVFNLATLYPSLKTNPRIKQIYQECSVCYEETRTHPACKHPLCVACWQSIPETIHEEDEDEEDEDCQRKCQKCPICRKDMSA
jgi:hypothetical protein